MDYAMVRLIFGIWPLLFGMFLLMVGNGLQGTLIGVRASIEGFSTLQLSAVTYTPEKQNPISILNTTQAQNIGITGYKIRVAEINDASAAKTLT